MQWITPTEVGTGSILENQPRYPDMHQQVEKWVPLQLRGPVKGDNFNIDKFRNSLNIS
jgi:hypothetical protein